MCTVELSEKNNVPVLKSRQGQVVNKSGFLVGVIQIVAEERN